MLVLGLYPHPPINTRQRVVLTVVSSGSDPRLLLRSLPRHTKRREEVALRSSTGNDASVIHVVLLGDSIFDNAAYVTAGALDVVRQVRQRMPYGSEVTLAAVDGSKTRDVHDQLRSLPAEATHLVVSAGGN